VAGPFDRRRARAAWKKEGGTNDLPGGQRESTARRPGHAAREEFRHRGDGRGGAFWRSLESRVTGGRPPGQKFRPLPHGRRVVDDGLGRRPPGPGGHGQARNPKDQRQPPGGPEHGVPSVAEGRGSGTFSVSKMFLTPGFSGLGRRPPGPGGHGQARNPKDQRQPPGGPEHGVPPVAGTRNRLCGCPIQDAPAYTSCRPFGSRRPSQRWRLFRRGCLQKGGSRSTLFAGKPLQSPRPGAIVRRF
jgi:hypothetical protein